MTSRTISTTTTSTQSSYASDIQSHARAGSVCSREALCREALWGRRFAHAETLWPCRLRCVQRCSQALGGRQWRWGTPQDHVRQVAPVTGGAQWYRQFTPSQLFVAVPEWLVRIFPWQHGSASQLKLFKQTYHVSLCLGCCDCAADERAAGRPGAVSGRLPTHCQQCWMPLATTLLLGLC